MGYKVETLLGTKFKVTREREREFPTKISIRFYSMKGGKVREGGDMGKVRLGRVRLG